MDSRYGAFNIPRRPVTSAADPPPPYSALPDRPPLPPRLRSSKSVAQLQQQQPVQPPDRLPPPPLPLSKDKSATTLPPGFVSSSSSPLLPDPPMRRAKSSVDLRRPQTATSKPAESGWKKALDEAQYLASGLLSSPAESTRHHTMIRHSSALVWYRGPATAVTLSVLSDAPLPAARTLWLQQKGFSGNIGMSVKALVGTKHDWLDVTPARQAAAADLPPNEERGIQRDLKRFAGKATGRLQGHCPRETHVVRIPAAAQDGYFRVVLCDGPEPGKVLVGSPVFRLASTSADVSVMRGAGLRTMPLEMGAKMASAVASTYVTAATGAAAGAAKMGVGKVASKVTNTALRRVAKQAVGDAVKESWSNNTAAARYQRAVSSAMMQPTVGVLGGQDGPDAPFPLKLAGRVVRGTGYTRARYGFPTANVAGASEELTMRMAGYFAAWARVLPGAEDWCAAVVRIGPAENAPPRIIATPAVAVHILQDMDGVDLCDAALQLLLMGFLRPLADDVAMQQHADDLLTTLATLAREDWQPQATMERMRAAKSARSWGQRLDGVTGMVASSVDRMPMHKAGIRSEAGVARDEGLGKGGLWIQR